MKLMVDGHATHVGTGGKDFDAELPCVLFLHGSGMDHRAWALQTRWFAYNGFAVLAPDFPGHSLSEGDAPISIEASAEWLIKFLHAAGVKKVHVVGHSQGFLSGLELCRMQVELVKSIVGIGTAAAIPVNPALIDTAKKSAAQAAEMMLNWGFGPKIHMGMSPTPGMQPIAIGRQIMGANPLAVDLQACADYLGGDEAAKTLGVPSAMILAGQDKMTPMRAGKATAELMGAELHLLEDFGHMLPIEAPKQVLTILKQFILKQK